MSRLCLVWVVALVADEAVRAELVTPHPVVNLGDIKGGQRHSRTFELSNGAAQPIEIVEVQRGCGCLAPRLDRRVLQPGEKAALTFELRTLGQADGPHTWNAQVHYRLGTETRVLPLALRGTIRNEVLVQPAILAVYTDRAARKEITLTDSRQMPLRVIAAQTRSPALKVAEVVRDGKVTRILLDASVEALAPGKHDGFVTILTDDRDYEELQVPVSVTKTTRPPLEVVPERPTIRIAAAAASASTLVRLRPTAAQAVRLVKVETDDPAATCTWAPGPGNDATLRIAVDVPRLKNPDAVLVTVTPEGSAGAVVPIPVVIER